MSNINQHEVYIGIGSNIGNSILIIKNVVENIKNNDNTISSILSPLYKSKPIEATGAYYINAVICIETTLSPFSLLKTLQDLEKLYGRIRNFKNEPRTIDLDILLYDNLKIKTADLIIPHPLMHKRAFVLKPLLDINSKINLPMGDINMFLRDVQNQIIEKI